MLISLMVSVAALGLQPDRDHHLWNLPPPPPCAFEDGAVAIERLSALPPHIRAAIGRFFQPVNGMADAGEDYLWNDVINSNDHRPRSRFVRAYFTEATWFIWFDQGGLGILRQTLAIRETRDRRTGELIAGAVPGSRFSGNLCAGSKAFLAGALNPGV